RTRSLPRSADRRRPRTCRREHWSWRRRRGAGRAKPRVHSLVADWAGERARSLIDGKPPKARAYLFVGLASWLGAVAASRPGSRGIEDAPGDRDVAVAAQRLRQGLIEGAALEHDDGRLRTHDRAELLDGTEESQLCGVAPDPPVAVDRECDRHGDDHGGGDP